MCVRSLVTCNHSTNVNESRTGLCRSVNLLALGARTIPAAASAKWEATYTDQLAEQLRSTTPSAICLLEP